MTAPRTPRYLVELLPVAFLPGLHTVLALLRSFFVPFVLTASTASCLLLFPTYVFYTALDAAGSKKVHLALASTQQPHEHRQESLCYRRDDTTHLRLRAIFLGWCFKHVTGA